MGVMGILPRRIWCSSRSRRLTPNGDAACSANVLAKYLLSFTPVNRERITGAARMLPISIIVPGHAISDMNAAISPSMGKMLNGNTPDILVAWERFHRNAHATIDVVSAVSHLRRVAAVNSGPSMHRPILRSSYRTNDDTMSRLVSTSTSHRSNHHIIFHVMRGPDSSRLW